jgi:hypothetical protein
VSPRVRAALVGVLDEDRPLGLREVELPLVSNPNPSPNLGLREVELLPLTLTPTLALTLTLASGCARWSCCL